MDRVRVFTAEPSTEIVAEILPMPNLVGWKTEGGGRQIPVPCNFQITVVVRSPRPTEIELHIEHVTACCQTDQSQSADDPDYQS